MPEESRRARTRDYIPQAKWGRLTAARLSTTSLDPVAPTLKSKPTCTHHVCSLKWHCRHCRSRFELLLLLCGSSPNAAVYSLSLSFSLLSGRIHIERASVHIYKREKERLVWFPCGLHQLALSRFNTCSVLYNPTSSLLILGASLYFSFLLIGFDRAC